MKDFLFFCSVLVLFTGHIDQHTAVTAAETKQQMINRKKRREKISVNEMDGSDWPSFRSLHEELTPNEVLSRPVLCNRTRFCHRSCKQRSKNRTQMLISRTAVIAPIALRRMTYICLPEKIRRCCCGGMPSFSSTRSLMRSTLSVGSISISISLPVSV